jgi:hypothetical protein
MTYFEHVQKISKQVITHLDAHYEEYEEEDFGPYNDEDLVNECIYGTVFNYGDDNNWHGDAKDMHGNTCVDMTFEIAQMIAGNSPSIEESFNGQYRKDTFRDVAKGALMHDVLLEIKKSHPEIYDPEFCDRVR